MVESVYDYERMSSGSGLASIGLSGVQHVDAQGAVLASHGYTYDAAGLVDTYTNDDGQADYSYDATGQLVGADYDYQDDESFNYDANGNRLEYTIGANNQVLGDGLYWYEYDEEGARTEKYQWSDTNADGQVDADERFDLTTYTWDARGRLTKITTKPDGQTTTRVVQYAYDYLNRRVEKKIDDSATTKTADRYTYLGHDIVLQSDKQGDLTHRYLHGPAVDQALADENLLDDNTLYPLFDNLGSVRDLADHNPSSGETSIVNHIVYDAFGRIVSQSDPTQTTIYGHTGRETDPESDLTFHRRRYYDAALGQFVSEDPIGFAAGDGNLYRYAGNSPTNWTDPSGLQEVYGPRLPSYSLPSASTPKLPVTGHGSMGWADASVRYLDPKIDSRTAEQLRGNMPSINSSLRGGGPGLSNTPLALPRRGTAEHEGVKPYIPGRIPVLYYNPDRRAAFRACGGDPACEEAFGKLNEQIKSTPRQFITSPIVGEGICHEWMAGFLKNYPEYSANGENARIVLGNGTLIVEPLRVGVKNPDLDTDGDGVPDSIATQKILARVLAELFFDLEGSPRGMFAYKDHAIGRVTFTPTGEVMYFDIGFSPMGQFGGPDHWWSAESNPEFLKDLDMTKTETWKSYSLTYWELLQYYLE